jgi:hypothetical protein
MKKLPLALLAYAALLVISPVASVASPAVIHVAPPTVAAPEGGATLVYLLLAGAACFGAMFNSRNQCGKRRPD